ncbi:MAG: leucine-rich repeat protein, partial [Clostridia bacterium]|nr:leucine-rich repeat protein [Clostridia bacterium]
MYRNRTIKALLLTILLMMLMNFAAVSEENDISSDFRIDSYGTITEYLGSDTEVIVPDRINGIEVKNIGSSAFIDCINIKSITLPEGVTSIGDFAFRGCSGLTSIT